MAAADEELARILTKITFRGLMTSCVITDDEYKVINEARGEKIAEVAYKKGLNITTLLQNADDLIDEHNERLQMKVWREIRELKLDLLSDVPRKKKSQAKQQPGLEEVESRLLSETIEEVAGLGPVEHQPENIEKSVSPSSDELPDFEKELIARKILAPGGFDNVSRFSPSLQRDNIENSVPPNITLNEVVPTPFNPNASIGDFGEASLNDIAVGGLFAGDEPFGRKLYNSLNSRGTPISPSLTRDANRSTNLRNLQPRNLSLLPEILVTGASDLQAPKTPQASRIQVQDMDLDIPPLDQPLQDQPPIEIPPILDDSAGQAPQAASGRVRESGGRARREHFEQIVEEVEAAKLDAPKRRRKPRRQRRSPSPEREYIEILELNRPLGRRKSKKRVPRLRVPPIRLSIIMDIFAGLEDYQPDPIDEIEDDQQEQQQPQQDPVIRPPLLDLDLDLDLHPQLPEQNLAQETPQLPQEQDAARAKRRRVDKTLEGISDQVQEISIAAEVPVIAAVEPQSIDVSAIEFPSVEVATVAPPIADATPRHRFAPSQTSTIIRDPRKIQQVTPDDIEYDRLRKASEAPLDPIPQEEGVSSIVGRMRRLRTEREKSAIENVASLMPTPPLQPESPKFLRFQGKSEKMIAFIGHDGVRETYSEYCLETVGFYMQIRFIMAEQISWKMKLVDLKASGISLMQPASDHVIKMRLYLLADNGFLKLAESEDQIIDVEIPIEPKDDEMAA